MDFHKIRHPSNFRFAERCDAGQLQFGSTHADLRLRDLGDDVFHLELRAPARWPLDARLVPLCEDAFQGPSAHRLQVQPDGALQLTGSDGRCLLQGPAGQAVGVCGSAWLLQFSRHAGMRFYGQGEKLTGLEKTGQRTLFWNADVWADHAMHTVEHGTADPQYASVPYLLVRCADDAWVGLLVDHPGAVFMDTGSSWCFTGTDDLGGPPSFWLGCDQGPLALYVIAGRSALDVTCRLQRLVGTTPLPPLWALGHHQCRWGYAGTADLQRLDAAFRAHAFPCDGLWLDIDYMDRFKVFTTSPQHFGDRAAELAALAAAGRKIVPILDPGVKVEPGDAVMDSGSAAGVWCLTPEGQPYVGFVWPGRTWFPDFSLPEARAWWAGQVARFRDWGFHGAWVDMNDPATGAAALEEMRFQHGAWPHWAYHNVYATGMAQATFEGFQQARPDERPFIVSRSAATGTSRWAAVWTGDNFSNWRHLQGANACTLNLALSGIPFNGPDVPGFGGHADRALAIAWYKAGFLFPFLRNHAAHGTVPQEPWAFGPEALAVIRHYVRWRYRLLPYLDQLWLAQQRDGAPVLRPLFLDFADTATLQLDRVDDAFLVGPAILQAPLLAPGRQARHVPLPGAGERWLDAATGQWLDGDRLVQADSGEAHTPLYLREGWLLPLQPGDCSDAAANDLATIDLLVLLGRGCQRTAVLDYQADDGASHAWQRGACTRLRITARRDGDALHLAVQVLHAGWRPVTLRVLGLDGATEAVVDLPSGRSALPLGAMGDAALHFTGAPLALAASAPLVAG